MRFLFLLLLCALPACQTERTVIAGPKHISEGSSDYNPQVEARSREIGQQAAASGVVGQFGTGGEGFQRLSSGDPGGYGRDGLNAMNEKVFGGNTKSQEMKSFTQTKDFLAKRYSNTRELDQKESFTSRMKSWLGGKKANTHESATETGRNYYDGDNVLANKANFNDGRTIAARDAHDSTRVAGTKDYYPAKKVIDRGGDAPKMLGEGTDREKKAVQRLIKSRPRDDPATVEEIRQLLGKSS
jgi:hypothetical protein